MRNRILAVLLLAFVCRGFAHRLDEYLQATILSLEPGRVNGSVRLVPGVAVFSKVVADIDTDGDHTIATAEEQAYAERVVKNLSLRVDGRLLPLQLVSFRFPEIEEMKQGVGEIRIRFTAALPPGGRRRRLIFENRHRKDISVYLVHCLVPESKEVQIDAQSRNQDQSF
jgi:hypothetical protein